MSVLIRIEAPTDVRAIHDVIQKAFGQDDEAALVDALRDGGFVRLSLVAVHEGRIVGHILFSDLPISTAEGMIPSVALAPLAVLPEFQRQGIGSELIRVGLNMCREHGHRIVVVLGHPEFYQKFGFSADLARPLVSPFSGDVWMAAELVEHALDGVAGRVIYAPPFGIP